jgi:hypothetical protein
MNLPNRAGDFRAGLVSLLPLLVLGFVLLGHVLFGMTSILPEWRTHSDLATQIAVGEQAVNQQLEEQQGAPLDIQRQLDLLQRRFNEAAIILLNNAQADGIVDKLYQYADDSRVKITDLQAQTAPEIETPNLYSIRAFRVQAEGPMRQLMEFVLRIREASAPGVVITNLKAGQDEGATSDKTEPTTLAMDILLYVSPYASGNALTDLAQMAIPTPLPPSPTPRAEALPSPTPGITATPTPQVIPLATLYTSTPDVPIVGLGTYDDSNPALRYTAGTWESIASQKGFGGSYHYSADVNAEVQFTFVGTDVAVQYVAFRNFGIFEVYVDGDLLGEVDSYALDGEFGKVVRVTSLAYTEHTITVRNTGRRNPASEGTLLALDAIHVLEPTLPTPTSGLTGG